MTSIWFPSEKQNPKSGKLLQSQRVTHSFGSLAWEVSEISPRCSVTLQIILSYLHLYIYLFIKSQITLPLRKKWPSVNCRRYLTGETHCAPISNPAVQWPSAVTPKNRCCKSIPRWLYFPAPWQEAAQPSSEETLKAPRVCLRLYDCSKREPGWWRCIVYSSSSPQVNMFQPLPWMGVSSFLTVQDQGFAYTLVWANVCSGSSLSCW